MIPDKSLQGAYTFLTSQVAQTAKAYPGFNSMKRLVILLQYTSPGWDASPSQVTPSAVSGFPGSMLVPIYTPGWREAL